jgi:hypothetical protein
MSKPKYEAAIAIFYCFISPLVTSYLVSLYNGMPLADTLKFLTGDFFSSIPFWLFSIFLVIPFTFLSYGIDFMSQKMNLLLRMLVVAISLSLFPFLLIAIECSIFTISHAVITFFLGLLGALISHCLRRFHVKTK